MHDGWVECLHSPRAYSRAQILQAIRVAYEVGRGRFILLEAPANCPICFGVVGEFCTHCTRR